MNLDHTTATALSIKWELNRQFGRLAEADTCYRKLWQRAAERAPELDDKSPALQALIQTGKVDALVHAYFRDIAGWDSLADLAVRFHALTQRVARPADVTAFVDAVLRDIAAPNARGRELVDLGPEDVAAIRARNSGNWISIDPEEVSQGEPLAGLVAKSRGFGELVEMAVAAGYQTDAIHPVLLSFHLYCLRQAMRAEALGGLSDVESWLSDGLYDGLLQFISELAADMRNTREAMLGGGSHCRHADSAGASDATSERHGVGAARVES